MIDVVYDGEIDECKADGGDRAAEVLADVARDAGLEFVAATDFGGTWAGMPEQVAAARAALPSWASSTVA
jgi:hypothetical protein